MSGNRAKTAIVETSERTMILSRRAGLTLMAASPFLLVSTGFSAPKSDFWNREEPSQWSSSEIQELLTDSPWAKPVTTEVKEYVPPAAAGGGMGGGRRGGGGRMGRTQSSGKTLPNSPKFSGYVRWVSAKPMLLAMKFQLPADFAEHYVIGVAGLPVISGHDAANSDSFEPLKETTYLQVHGQDPVQPGIIREDPKDTSTVLFGFLSQLLDLSHAKAATFSSTIGPLNVKARFELAHMKYRGELAV
jgi:hypothetical protein